ncbi:hypothetical protein BEH94_11900 [Candidatus Altiarchaeales archaeon WOR_SM1_SCG]|nr:hypothetical protein BEH94_11900 [Candidatus Altiarchaeales archaeon WOR_SM1_SCG]
MILLDTTYILPLYGIDIKIPGFESGFEEILSSSEKPGISSISVLEAKGKLTKFFNTKEGLKRYKSGFIAITESLRFKIFDFVDREIDKNSTKIFLYGHRDIFDCIIAATALKHADLLVTEDIPLKKIMNKLFPDFKVLEWSEFAGEY